MEDDELRSIIQEQKGFKRALLERFVTSIASEAKINRNKNHRLGHGDFPNILLDFLLAYHSFTDEVINKKSFEYMFKTALNWIGEPSKINDDPTFQGADIISEARRYSLKTEASKKLNPNKITISKFMEARWIRECETKSDFISTIGNKICKHLNGYDEIYMLRGKIDNDVRRYTLLEIPKSLLACMVTASEDAVSNRTKNGSATAEICNAEGNEIFNLRWDGSVEKITISNIEINNCILVFETEFRVLDFDI